MAAQSVEIPDGQVLCVHTSACMPFEQTRLSVQSWQRETQSLRALTERKTRAQRLDDLDVGNFHCSLILSFEMLLALGSLACGGADVAGRQWCCLVVSPPQLVSPQDQPSSGLGIIYCP